MGHHNICIYSVDTNLVLRVASAFSHDQRNRLYLARDLNELLLPGVLRELDILLVDEKLAELDTWNVTNVVRQMVASSGDRFVAIIGLVESLGNDLLMRGVEFGVDAFLQLSSLGDQLLDRVQFLAQRVPERADAPEGSPYRPFRPFMDDLSRQMTLVEVKSGDERATGPLGTQTFTANGISVTLSLKTNQPPPSSEIGLQRTRIGSVESTRPLPLVGKTFGKILLQDCIGRGGGGAVYRGRHTSLDMSVAVKVLHPDLVAQDPVFAARFLEEARTAARITDSSVVRVLDCDLNAETGCYYIVMEFIEGNSLEDEILQAGWIPEFRLTEMALAVVRCLVSAENLGIVHRDIKPANILLASDGQVKLADLGLARSVANPIALASGRLRDSRIPAPTSRIAGTPHYIAPEQITSDAEVDSRADVYALGATLFHAATGQHLFAEAEINELLFQHLHAQPSRVDTIQPRYSARFADIVERMLAKDRDQRYSSCRELHGVLREHFFWLIQSGRYDRPSKSFFGRLRRTLRLMHS